MSNRVLFAEDETLIRQCTSELLRLEGFDVVEAENGDTAACFLETQSFNLLLTDVRMPGLKVKDGFDLAKHARRSNPTMPIVVITGYADNVGTRLRDLGEHVVLLNKPFRLQELVAALLGAVEEGVVFDITQQSS